MTHLYTCPNCEKKFGKIIEDNQRKFCPHCDIQLFVKGDCNDNGDFQSIDIKKQTLLSIVKSGGIALIIFALLWLSVYIGIYDYLQKHDNIMTIIWSVYMILWIIWCEYKNRKYSSKQGIFYYGVDKLEDYQADYCEYKMIIKSLRPHQCPQCQSYRMVDLFWFKRKTENTLDGKQYDENNFVGCLACKTPYTAQTTRATYANYWLWGSLLIFIMCLIGGYSLLLDTVDVSQAIRKITILSFFMCACLFFQFQSQLHVKDPFKTTYSKLD